MSIPPLVCSTPPPPDQCEDDKDDDFDIQYRLSLDEDEEIDAYNYGNISTYKDYCQENKENVKEISLDSPDLSNKIANNKTFDDTNVLEDINTNKNNKSPKNEEVAIEDLNLKIEEDTLITGNFDNTDDPDTYGISCIVNHLDSPDKTIHASNTNEDEDSSDEKSQSEMNNISIENNEIHQENCVNATDVVEETHTENILISQSSELTKNETEMEEKDTENVISNIEDDFEDFDNFKFTTTTSHATLAQDEALPSFENPWNSDNTEDFSFGDFKANFDSNSNESIKQDQVTAQAVFSKNEANIDDNDDDDFGDFDDFKSSAQTEPEKQTAVDSQISRPVPVFNLQCPDNEAQIIDSINNILFDIFTEEIPNDGEVKPERDLESLLTEVWHHLKLVDERQPYIIQWNNSLGQKSLLRALCIDSRNILFGPKWNYFTPKYAPNLSAAPLQPQKPPASIPNTSSSDVISEKTTSKENTTWSDPFSSDGQEFTYAEALLLDLENLMATLDQMAHKHSTLKISDLLSSASSMEKEPTPKEIRPSDLDVFENAISVTSIDNIHSSTLSVQPLRHINLPDTHIFTPTDSETPRSKTIHYDNGPPILLPQQIIENHTLGSNKIALQHTENKNNDDYWEFQDFKGVPERNLNPTPDIDGLKPTDKDVKISNPPSSSSITYQTQVLQPVKLEPIMPKLNWPDPGEVKETFDDFSDFISQNNWSNGGEDATEQITPADNSIDETPNKSTIEDEFETFQSAAPPVHNHINHSVNLNPIESVNQSPTQSQTAKLTLNPITILAPNSNNSSPIQNNTNSKSSSIIPLNPHPINPNSILQPINSVNTTRPQQAAQILQPLSLESYSQINWPKPGIDLQNLASFNPLESLQLLKGDTGSSGPSKVASPVHSKGSAVQNDVSDDDIWGDFVSSKPKEHAPKKTPTFAHDDEWTDFVSSPSLSQNSLNTISFNVQTNSSMQKNLNVTSSAKSNQNIPLDIPTLNYITPKSSNRGAYIDKHFQNL